MNPTYATESDQLMRMLEMDRIDVAVMDRGQGLASLRRAGVEGIKILEPPLSRVPTYHYLHVKHAYLVPTITAALKNMHVSGRLTILNEQFLNEPEDKSSGDMPEPSDESESQ